jgi:hypothetical protein
MKNKATIMAMQDNPVHTFNSFKEFEDFMKDSSISPEWKKIVQDEIITKSALNHQSIINYVPNGLFKNIDN